MIYIIMGVSGSGKSTIGHLLSQEVQLPFMDADDFHPEDNIKKMSNSIPLNDQDRWDWLKLLSQNMHQWERQHGGAILACSALKRSYRDILRQDPSIEVNFIYLKGSFKHISKRLETRSDHFMCKSLLQSQFDILEEPSKAVVVDLKHPPEKQLETILASLVCPLA